MPGSRMGRWKTKFPPVMQYSAVCGLQGMGVAVGGTGVSVGDGVLVKAGVAVNAGVGEELVGVSVGIACGVGEQAVRDRTRKAKKIRFMAVVIKDWAGVSQPNPSLWLDAAAFFHHRLDLRFEPVGFFFETEQLSQHLLARGSIVQ